MNNFNTKRWLRYTKRHLYQHRSKLVRHMLIVFVITLVFTLLASYFTIKASNNSPSLYEVKAMIGMYFLFAFLGLVCLAPSKMNEDLRRKQVRIRELLVPASNLEKFISKYLIYAFLLPIVSFILIILADELRAVYLRSLVGIFLHSAFFFLILWTISLTTF